ncbi:formin-like protein [Anastrepha ludens]|uniref:formin-like protein n=1 Tax=Anastrepha ludens TaxID=28586 RepID=UPI0023B0ED93|nr:formin-like protein [Anastrepha ludens]
MGAVSSRHISTSDVLVEEGGGAGGGHGNSHDHGNGNCSITHKNGITTATGGFLQKQDLHYDIGSSSQYHHVRQPSVRSRSQQPMPTTEELDRRFAKVLVSHNFILFINISYKGS